MSSTIGDLVDRVYREYLEPVDKVESYSYLTGGITDTTTTTIGYANDMFSTEEEDALDAGAIIEINQELMFSKSLNTVTNEITVERGARGTTATTHDAGDVIKIAPAFPRKNVYEAVNHILKYGTMHTDCILTNNAKTAKVFLQGVNSSIAMHNVSTQFADGGEFGFGGEIGISTNKLPPRGPVGINQLTSYKYVVSGKGVIRP